MLRCKQQETHAVWRGNWERSVSYKTVTNYVKREKRRFLFVPYCPQHWRIGIGRIPRNKQDFHPRTVLQTLLCFSAGIMFIRFHGDISDLQLHKLITGHLLLRDACAKNTTTIMLN